MKKFTNLQLMSLMGTDKHCYTRFEDIDNMIHHITGVKVPQMQLGKAFNYVKEITPMPHWLQQMTDFYNEMSTNIDVRDVHKVRSYTIERIKDIEVEPLTVEQMQGFEAWMKAA